MALAYLDFDGRSSGNAEQVYSDLSIGTASADRWVILGIFASRNASTAETVTTSEGTPDALGTEIVEGARSVRLYKINVTTGTTLDVTITGNAGGASFYETAVFVWVEDAGEPTLVDQDSALWASGIMSCSVDVEEGGAVIGFATVGFNSGTVTWAGATADFNTDTPANIDGASEDGLSAETGRVVSASVSGGGFENVLNVVSYSLPAAGGSTGSGAGAAAGQTGEGTGTRTVTGDGAGTAAGQTGEGTGTRTVTGDGAGTAAAQTGDGTGTRIVTGSGAGAAAGQTGEGTGTRTEPGTSTGSGAGTAAGQTGDGAGTRTVTGDGAGTAAGQTGEGTGTRTPKISGAGGGTAAGQTGDGAGTRTVTGDGAGTAAGQTGDGTGTRLQIATGSGVGTAAAQIGEGTGTRTVTGSGAGIVAGQTGDGVGRRLIDSEFFYTDTETATVPAEPRRVTIGTELRLSVVGAEQGVELSSEPRVMVVPARKRTA